MVSKVSNCCDYLVDCLSCFALSESTVNEGNGICKILSAG